MKIATLEKYVFDHFFPVQEILPTAEEASMANVVMQALVTAPGFEGAYTNHQLFEWAPGFVRLGFFTHRESQPSFCDVFQDYYSSDWYGDEDEEPNWIELPEGAFSTPVALPAAPAGMAAVARLHLEILAERHPEVAAVLAPSGAALKQRRELQIEQAVGRALGPLVEGIQGTQHDPCLKRQGIVYHHPTSSSLWNHPWVFWVAHNGDEIAGVLGAMELEEDKSLSLSYVSVAPGFRNQGLATRLMNAAMDYGVQKELFFVRSSPGVFSEEHPKVAQGFDRCVMAHAIPHVSGGSGSVAWSLARARRELPWEAFCEMAKPLCDEWLEKCPSLHGSRRLEYGVENAFARDFDAQVDAIGRRLTAPSPGPRPRLRGP